MTDVSEGGPVAGSKPDWIPNINLTRTVMDVIEHVELLGAPFRSTQVVNGPRSEPRKLTPEEIKALTSELRSQLERWREDEFMAPMLEMAIQDLVLSLPSG